MEKVILAFEGERTAERLREILESASVASCLICRSAAEVKRVVGKQGVNVVICGFKLSDETAENLFADLPDYCSMMVLAVESMLSLIENDDIFRLSAPASRNDFISSTRMLLQIGRRMERFVRPRRTPREREIIEAAKALLMDRNSMTEEQAHRFLQKKSMDEGVKMVQTAQLLLDGDWTI